MRRTRGHADPLTKLEVSCMARKPARNEGGCLGCAATPTYCIAACTSASVRNEAFPVRGSAQEKRNPPMFVSMILLKIRAYLAYRETVRELSQLTDRELDDLGIARFEIDGVARSHASA
ncbi:MAG: DUF1127 domain-containing protein [Microvirga sp.]